MKQGSKEREGAKGKRNRGVMKGKEPKGKKGAGE